MINIFDKNKRKYNKLSAELKSRWSFDEYLSYRMQEMPEELIPEIMTEDELWAAEGFLNADEYRNIFNDKRLFYQRFSAYINRRFMYIDEGCEEQLETFFAEHGRLIFKPAKKYAGIGVFTAESMEAIKKPLPEMIAEGYIAEELLKPAQEYAAVYPGSLNTVRLTTLINDEGKPEILFAVNQFGSSGSEVDNDDITGIWSAADLETGIIEAVEINPENGYVNDRHPDTGMPIAGFVNPRFGEMKKLVLEAAAIVPECRLIGWDVAVKEDYSLEIIEGNVSPELNLYQKISHRGLRKILDKYTRLP